MHAQVRSVIRRLSDEGHSLRTSLQNCAEFWNVSTRPLANNGFGFTVDRTFRLLRLVERISPILPDTPDLYSEWRRLVFTYRVSGVQVHDARLVALMKIHQVTHILTFNTVDFARYSTEQIIAVAPTQPESK
jgi:predicted nucleic acid-binding protein